MAAGLIRLLTASTLLFGALFAVPQAVSAATTASSGSSVGAIVDEVPTTTTTTTEPPPTTTTTTTEPPPATTTTPTTEAPVVEEEPTAEAEIVTTPAEEPAPEIQEAPAPPEDKGVMAVVKSAVEGSKKIVKGVLDGKAVADAVNDVLPAPVASVVVPAVRTASTFAFPIGLAGGVFGFLILQQRIDASDPKLTAAPLAHDDDVIEFR